MVSNFVGAVKTLPASSLVTFNPWDTPRFSEQINTALRMSEEEKEKRHKSIMTVVDTWTRSVLGAHPLQRWRLSRIINVVRPKR